MQSNPHANASSTCRRVGNRCETKRWGKQEGALHCTVPRARCRQVSKLSTDCQHARGTAGHVTAPPFLSLTVYEWLPACSQTPQTLARCLLSLGGAEWDGAKVRRRIRRTVSPLSGTPRRVAIRAPASPPASPPSTRTASVDRTVRWAWTEASVGRR